jgi:ABC-2 type transport system ATP-binding protein
MAEAAEAAIEAQGLVKHYGDITAVDHIDLTVPPNTIYALLGPNGAGKTTTINILTTLSLPTEGSARVMGYDVVREAERVRRCIGVTFQDIVLDRSLSGWQVLDIHGKLYRLSRRERQQRISQLVELVQLEDAIKREVQTYSGGMKRRLELARGLLTRPAILFLDEPTQGLDPQNRVGIWEYIRNLNREQGLTVLLTTHYMDEAEALAHTVGIIDHGRMVAEDTPDGMVAALGSEVIRVRGGGNPLHFVERLSTLSFVERVETIEQDGLLHIYVDSSTRRLADVVGAASTNGFVVEDISVARPSLGDAFLHHTGHALRD